MLAAKGTPLKDGDRIKFLITGASHNGLLFARRLIEAGFSTKDMVLLDTAGGFGGTWYWNRYPGLMCDIESYIYLPLLEETGYVPKHKYSYGEEIRTHSERIASKWNIQGTFCTKVAHQEWDDQRGRWTVKLMRQLGPENTPEHMTVHARFVFTASGFFSIPKVPKAPGFLQLRDRHHVFHTSRWDYTYKGGSQENPSLSNLRDKRVAILGTGATAIQVVPALAKWAKHVYVIQRTPSYCGERNQRPTDAQDWVAVASHKGWQEDRRINFDHFTTNDPVAVDLVDDDFTDFPGGAGLVGSPTIITPEKVDENRTKLFQVDVKRCEKVRARIHQEIKGPSTADKLTPWYPGWCKRPTYHDEYLTSFNRPNVTLIDTDGKGIEEFTDHTIIAGGEEIEVELLVLLNRLRWGKYSGA